MVHFSPLHRISLTHELPSRFSRQKIQKHFAGPGSAFVSFFLCPFGKSASAIGRRDWARGSSGVGSGSFVEECGRMWSHVSRGDCSLYIHRMSWKHPFVCIPCHIVRYISLSSHPPLNLLLSEVRVLSHVTGALVLWLMNVSQY